MLFPSQGQRRTGRVQVQGRGGRDVTQAVGSSRPAAQQASPRGASPASHARCRGHGRYSRAGPRQLAEAAGGLPHQVHGPPVGRQREQHVVADLFVAEHLLLEGRSQRAVTSCPSGRQPPGPQAPHGLQTLRPHPGGSPAPPDDNCISLIISMEPGHASSWDLSCCSSLSINDLGTEKHSEHWVDFLAQFSKRGGEGEV